MDGIAAAIGQLWQGKAPLWVAFWVYGQGVYALVLAAYFTMYKFGFEFFAPLREKLASAGVLGQVVQGLAGLVNVVDGLGLLFFSVLWFVAIWRCAPNTDWVVWTWAARGFVVAVGVLLVAGGWIWLRG